MRTHLFAILLLSQSFTACQSQENASVAVSNANFKAVAVSQKSLEKSMPVASNIIFQSADGGQTWQDVSEGLPVNLTVRRVYANDGEVLLASGRALYRSGASSTAPAWEDAIFLDVEISGFFGGKVGPYITSYENGFFKNIPGTNVLIPLHNALKDKTIRAGLETLNGTLFVGCESGLYKSTDEGNTWKQVFSENGVNSLVEAEGVLICGTYKGVLRSTDGGENWDQVLTEDGSAWDAAYLNGRFVTITQGAGKWGDNSPNRLRMSADGGKTWQRMDENLFSAQLLYNREVSDSPAGMINDLNQVGEYLFCSTNDGVFRSSDWGKNWQPVFTDSGLKLLQLVVSGKVIYAIKVAGC
jgi:photosystem II stability/assembly factor-like uncharacterized protein